ncbi:hypothetical protein FM037_08175 [Shewanella psychropiezotolerans]|uniref:Uncharacterized protein n=1 Tax=Shewanella psychropiezotolerans TaxID=2593655 RepID=A0ABX5WW03_9GAMM|nr:MULTISPECIES: hypothetical protein [Shewanella]MPY22477.1 hypothetical protein [Shewanella sp. YLB-07]QDO83209.1 hypothetical protein FM037_08175 [Shewanella psychropiezotolerans]
MKNVFKIATISALVMLAGNAVAVESTGNFQWTGTVAAANVIDPELVIVDTGTVGHNDGTLTFAVDETTKAVTVSSSSELSFNVEDSTGAQANYFYALTNLKFSSGGGLLGEDTAEEFSVMVDSSALVKNTSTAAAESVIMTLETGASGMPSVAEGDEVVVQATVLISDAAI